MNACAIPTTTAFIVMEYHNVSNLYEKYHKIPKMYVKNQLNIDHSMVTVVSEYALSNGMIVGTV